MLKRALKSNKDKEDTLKKFCEVFGPQRYYLWHLEYHNLQTEYKIL